MTNIGSRFTGRMRDPGLGRMRDGSDEDEDGIRLPEGTSINGVAICRIAGDLILFEHWPTCALGCTVLTRIEDERSGLFDEVLLALWLSVPEWYG